MSSAGNGPWPKMRRKWLQAAETAVAILFVFVVVDEVAGQASYQSDIVSCTLGASCTIELSAWTGIPQSGSRRREWTPSSYVPTDYGPDPALYWVMIVDENGGSSPCDSGSFELATFDCYNSAGPPGPPQQWQNPRGNNDDNPAGYELCPNGATAGSTSTDYAICWVENPSDLGTSPDFTYIGSFRMYGPEVHTMSCTMGKLCEVTLIGRLDDASFDDSAVMIVRGTDDGACRLKLYTDEAVDFNDATRSYGDFTMPATSTSSTATTRTYEFGVATITNDNEPSTELPGDYEQRGSYRVCWAITSTMFDSTAADYYDMRKGVDAGAFELYGPMIEESFDCTLTLDCSIDVRGKFYVGMDYAVIVSVEDTCGASDLTSISVGGGTWSNPVAGTSSSTSAYTASFGTPTWGTASDYTVCWAGGASVDADYAVRLGSLGMAGPTGCSNCECYKGKDCTVLLTVHGLSEEQAARSRVQILESGSSCAEANLSTADLSPLSSERRQDGGVGTEFVLGVVKSGVAHASYKICWGAGQDASDGSAYTYVEYDFDCTLDLGTFSLYGANYGDMTCTLGIECQLVLTGVSLASSNRLVILDDSEDATECFLGDLAEFSTLGELTTRTGGEPALSTLEVDASSPYTTYTMGIPDGVPDGGERSSYLVCWAHDATLWVRSQYVVPVGKLTLLGPTKQAVTCDLSEECTITLAGLGLSSTNGIMIIPLTGYTCGVTPMDPPTFSGMTNPQVAASASGTSQVFQMGTLLSAPLEPGTNYQICWASNPSTDADYRVYVGSFHVSGMYVFSDPPCGSFVPGSDPYCVLGELCEVGKSPQQLTIDVEVDTPSASNGLAVVVKRDTCCASGHTLVDFREVKPSNLDSSQTTFPNPVSASGTNYLTYDLGRPSLPVEVVSGRVTGAPGDYLLCWSKNPSDLSDYNTPVGTLQIRGPYAQDTSCILGEFCSITLSGSFLYYSAEDNPVFTSSRLLIMPDTHVCGEEGSELATWWTGFTNPAPRPNSGDISTSSIAYEFDTPTANPPSRSYKLCWDYNPSNGDIANPSLYEEFRVFVGSFTMNGPYQGQSKSCNLGSPCKVEIDGIGLASTNRLLIISEYGGSCGSIPPNTPMLELTVDGITNPRLVTDDASDNSYDMGLAIGGGSYSECRVGDPRETCIGSHYRMCWSHGVDKNSIDDYPYYVDIGSFSLVGVFGTYAIQCALYTICSFNIFGLELSTSNQVVIIDEGSTCGDSSPTVATFEGLLNPRRARSTATLSDGRMEATFRLGNSTSGTFGTYRLCWGFNPVVLADYKVEVGPFYFMEPPASSKCSVWDNYCFEKTDL